MLAKHSSSAQPSGTLFSRRLISMLVSPAFRTFVDLNRLLARSAPWRMLLIIALEAAPTLASATVFLIAKFAAEHPDWSGHFVHSQIVMLVFAVQLVLTFAVRASNAYIALEIRDDIAGQFLHSYELWRQRKPLVIVRRPNVVEASLAGSSTRYLNRYLNGVARAFYSLFVFFASISALSYLESAPAWLFPALTVGSIVACYAAMSSVGITEGLILRTREYVRRLNECMRTEKLDESALQAFRCAQKDLRTATLHRLLLGSGLSAIFVAATAVLVLMSGIGQSPNAVLLLLVLLLSLSWLVSALTECFAALPLVEPLIKSIRQLEMYRDQVGGTATEYANFSLVCIPDQAELRTLPGSIQGLPQLLENAPVAVRFSDTPPPLTVAAFFYELSCLTGCRLMVTSNASADEVTAMPSQQVTAVPLGLTGMEFHWTFVSISNASEPEFTCHWTGRRLMIYRKVGRQRETVVDVSLNDSSLSLDSVVDSF